MAAHRSTLLKYVYGAQTFHPLLRCLRHAFRYASDLDPVIIWTIERIILHSVIPTYLLLERSSNSENCVAILSSLGDPAPRLEGTWITFSAQSMHIHLVRCLRV